MESVRIWGHLIDGKIVIQNYTENFKDMVLNVMKKSFFLYEAVSIGSQIDKNVNAQKDLELLCLDALKSSGVTLIALDKETGIVVGVSINVIQTKPAVGESSYFESFRDNVCKTDNAKSLMNYMIDMDSKLNLFEHFQIDSLMEVMFLAVLPENGRHKIGYYLTLYSVQLAQEIKNGKNLNMLSPENRVKLPQLVSSLPTAIYSQKIFETLGFKIMITNKHSNYFFNGKSFADRLGDQDAVSTLVALQLK